MKKKILFMAFAVFSICAASAQDSTHKATTKQVHKKTIHTNSTTMSMDSVNGGKIVTNPHGKQDSTHNATTKQVHKKTAHTNMSMDSVNGGKIVTNPHGKVDSKSSAIKRKTTKSTIGSNSTDSTK